MTEQNERILALREFDAAKDAELQADERARAAHARVLAALRRLRETEQPGPVKVYIHERPEGVRCQTGWAEHDTMAPHQVRHECERSPHPDDDQHVCTCGLIEIAA